MSALIVQGFSAVIIDQGIYATTWASLLFDPVAPFVSTFTARIGPEFLSWDFPTDLTGEALLNGTAGDPDEPVQIHRTAQGQVEFWCRTSDCLRCFSVPEPAVLEFEDATFRACPPVERQARFTMALAGLLDGSE
jgi:hypothetical protein